MSAETADEQQQQQEEDEDIDGEPEKDDDFDNKQEESESESEPEPGSESESEFEDKNSASSDSERDDDDPEKKAAERKNPESHFRKFKRALESRWVKKKHEKEERMSLLNDPENMFDFPRDRENWREQDIGELWADGPIRSGDTGWDPALADDEDIDIVEELVRDGEDPPIAPFYLPYRKYYPSIPDNHYDISNPKSVIEELDRIEEFLMWASYIFPDGSSYEGTVWDDLAHGKGVYVAEEGLVRYEGEWLRNDMEGHGVVEVDIPDVEPVPGSKLEAKMRAEGRIITRDFMTPEDKEWLEMDVEDSVLLADGIREVPFYERAEWIRIFGNKPEKGRYRYAGQWKHGRMHGCGVYEVNEHIIYGRFYFGQHVEDSVGCDSDVSALHAGIAEVAAAKARMFINKPDGMVREERGPYGDPQHPYFYEEDDAWMAPGFVHQFYEVPDYWKTYAEEVDQEREMWLNSFYKAPLRIPMPAELEHWWSRDPGPEFILVNKEPEPDPEDPSKLIHTEDPLIIHTPTGRVINYVEDEEHGVRLFWQPDLTEGEDVDPEKAEFLPLGFDEFYGRTTPSEKKQSRLRALITSMENAVKPLFDRLEKWVEEKRKASELNRNLIEQELDFIEAEICLEETLEDMENELKMEQKEEEKKDASEQKEEERKAASEKRNDRASGEAGEDEAESEDEDENEDAGAPTSFGTVQQQETDKSEKKSGKSPFSSLTLSLTTPGLISMVPSKLQDSFLSWRAAHHQSFTRDLSCGRNEKLRGHRRKSNSVMFPHPLAGRRANLKAVVERSQLLLRRNGGVQLKPLAQIIPSRRKCESPQMGDHGSSSSASCKFSILSMHVPVDTCTLA